MYRSAEEMRRRLLHMDIRHSRQEQMEVMKDFLQKLCDSGYSHPTRMEIVKSAARKYYRQRMNQDAGGQRLYRSAEEMAGARRIKPLLNITWFKSKRGGHRVTPAKDVPQNYLEQEMVARKSDAGAAGKVTGSKKNQKARDTKLRHRCQRR